MLVELIRSKKYPIYCKENQFVIIDKNKVIDIDDNLDCLC